MKLVVESPAGKPESVSIAINPEECGTLRLYLAEYERLMACRPMQAEIPCEISFSTSEGGGLTIESEVPSEDDRAVLFHRLRPFILAEEPASFERVAGLLGRQISQPVVRNLLALQHQLWRGQAFASQGLIKVNGRRLNGERLFMTWLNGVEYHRDLEKMASVESTQRLHFFRFFDWVLVNLLTDKLRAISNLAALVALVLGDSSELGFRDHRLVRSDG